MDTDTFVSKLDGEGGLAPVNRFIAKIYMPSSAGSYNEGGGTEILSYLCDKKERY